MFAHPKHEEPMSTDVPPPIPAGRQRHVPQNHRTIDRVSDILEHVSGNPGMTFSELARKVGGAKSSLHGFISGLLARGWLYQSEGRFYMGPAMYSLTMANGHEATRFLNNDDLRELHEHCCLPVYLGVQAGEALIYISVAGRDPIMSYESRTNIRRTMLNTAGGKVLLAFEDTNRRDKFLAQRPAEERDLVEAFLSQYYAIIENGYAVNYRSNVDRYAIASCLRGSDGRPVASVTLVGKSAELRPREEELTRTLLDYCRKWSARLA
jgi:DNA-binding IclR family transcriptional regulator